MPPFSVNSTLYRILSTWDVLLYQPDPVHRQVCHFSRRVARSPGPSSPGSRPAVIIFPPNLPPLLPAPSLALLVSDRVQPMSTSHLLQVFSARSSLHRSRSMHVVLIPLDLGFSNCPPLPHSPLLILCILQKKSLIFINRSSSHRSVAQHIHFGCIPRSHSRRLRCCVGNVCQGASWLARLSLDRDSTLPTLGTHSFSRLVPKLWVRTGLIRVHVVHAVAPYPLSMS